QRFLATEGLVRLLGTLQDERKVVVSSPQPLDDWPIPTNLLAVAVGQCEPERRVSDGVVDLALQAMEPMILLSEHLELVAQVLPCLLVGEFLRVLNNEFDGDTLPLHFGEQV